MEKSKKSINVEGGFLFCGGWNFSKSVSVGPTFIREMRVGLLIITRVRLQRAAVELGFYTLVGSWVISVSRPFGK